MRLIDYILIIIVACLFVLSFIIHRKKPHCSSCSGGCSSCSSCCECKKCDSEK